MLTHHSTELDPAARGIAFGHALRPAVRATAAVYERMLGEVAGLDRAGLLESGAGVGHVLASGWPELLGELEGIARGAGLRPELLLAANARTELLGGRGASECSVVALRDGPHGCRVAQNWDWHPALRQSVVLWTVAQPAGRWFTTLTEAGLLAKIGVSSAGLCCALNLLRCSLDGGVGGLPVHVLLRALLDRCETPGHAVRLLRSARVTASSCVTLGSQAGGDAALLGAELSPGGCRVLLPSAEGRLAHTNHFVGPPASGSDLERREAPGTLDRLRELERELGRGRAAPELLLRSHANAVCRHEDHTVPWAQRRATLACVIMEPGLPRMRVAAGPPCRTPFREVGLPRPRVNGARAAAG